MKSTSIADDTGDTSVVALSDVLSRTPGPPLTMQCDNRTTYAVDLYHVIASGVEQRFATLEPGEMGRLPLPSGRAVVVRALIRQELVSVHLPPPRQAGSSEAPVEIDCAITVMRAYRQLLEPKVDSGPDLGNLKLVETPKTAEPPESRAKRRGNVTASAISDRAHRSRRGASWGISDE